MKKIKLIAVIFIVMCALFMMIGCSALEPDNSDDEVTEMSDGENNGESVDLPERCCDCEHNDEYSDDYNGEYSDEYNGIFEGELDENGNFTGWGIWTYRNFRYEGYFVDGVPNGEGTLYEARVPPEQRREGVTYFILIIISGVFENGVVNGEITDIRHREDGKIHHWSYSVTHGVPQDGIVGYCSDCSASLQLADGHIVGGVPPWADVVTNPSVPAPQGER